MLRLVTDTEAMEATDMEAMAEVMEDMVVTEATEDTDMERGLLRLMLRLVMDTEATEATDTEAMAAVMDMERGLLKLSPVMDTEATDMEDMVEAMEAMEDMDTEATDMESEYPSEGNLKLNLNSNEISFSSLVIFMKL